MATRFDHNGIGPLILVMLLVVGQAAALVTHVWSAVERHQWIFLALGTLAYPIGMAHGVGVWFGCWK